MRTQNTETNWKDVTVHTRIAGFIFWVFLFLVFSAACFVQFDAEMLALIGNTLVDDT